ncbi:hypothetical protein GGI20_003485 [Coemansia sp. BCRC 34301]|nr:hypothetical protein GGI20_003485 [Coemansia sp. BCRC 34301]
MDPLLAICEAVGHSGPLAGAEAVTTLYQLYESSADVRACLRLVDPAYLDALSAADLASKASKEDTNGVYGAGTRMAGLLAQALSKEGPMAATLLADTMSKAPMPGDSIVNALLERIREGESAEAHTRLVLSLNDSGPWMRPLLCELASAITATPVDGKPLLLSQLLGAAARLVEADRQGALAVLAGLESLRGFARHVIRLLSVPLPVVAAPALHLLTLLLLHPPNAPLALVALADGLCGKLFDASHMARTLVLASDLCLNCQNGLANNNDLVVLDAVAGVVAAIAGGDDVVRRAFYDSTELVPAIVHVTALARVDRRYAHPVLRMVSAIAAQPEDSLTPLFRALTFFSDDTPSVVGDLLDLVLAGIEDIGDAVPGSRDLPRVASDEGGCCWLANCSDDMRSGVARFLGSVLRSPTVPETGRWVQLVVEAAAAALAPFFFPPPSSTTYSRIARYYWVARPVLALTGDLADQCPEFRTQWQAYLDHPTTGVSAWAASLCLGSVSLCRDIADAFTVPLPDVYGQAKTVTVDQVPTPSSSGAVSPAHANEITDVPDRVREAVLAHWLRTCEAKTALTLAPSSAHHPQPSFPTIPTLLFGVSTLRHQHLAHISQLNLEKSRAQQLANDCDALRQALDDAKAAHVTAAKDADEWRSECVRTRDCLDETEKSARDQRLALAAQHSAVAEESAALERALANAVSRLRALEAQSDADRLLAADLRVKNAAMADKLSDLAGAATALHSLAQRPH